MARLALLVLLLFLARASGSQDLDAGRRIYLDGVTPSGEPLAALVGFGRTPLSGQAVACGNCHGADGKGRPEASVLPQDITWEELTKPYGHSRATGRKYGAFNERTFTRAVNEGLDPAGNTLDWSMPRYALSRAEAEALIAYVKRLGGERDPGIGDASLRIGSILPQHAGAAEAMRTALEAYVENVNRAGGIHQRRLELVVMNEESKAQPVFALLSATESGIGAADVPTVAPFAPPPDRVAEHQGQVFRVFPGIVEQAAVLVEFAARRKGASPLRGAILASGAAADEQAAQAAAQRCAARNCGDVARIGWYATRFDAAAAVQRLKAEGREHLFFFGAHQELERLLDAAGRAADSTWRPSVYAAGSLAQTALAARERYGTGQFLGVPALPARAPLQALRREFGLPAQHEGAQTAVLAAAAVLVEALRRAGRDLSRERFVQSLESLSNYDPGGFAPPVSYGPDRRTGARGGYVVAVEAARGIVPASRWIPLD